MWWWHQCVWGQQFTNGLRGGFCICSLGTGSGLDVLSGPEGIGAGRLVRTEVDRVAVEVVVVEVGHNGCHSWRYGASSAQFPVFSTPFLCGFVFPYWGKGIRALNFLTSPLNNLLFSYWERKGLYPSAPGAVCTHLGCLVSPVCVDTFHCPDGHFHINCVFWEDTVEVMKIKVMVALAVEVEIHTGKVSILSYTVSWELESKVNQVIPCFSVTWKSGGSFFIICLILNLSLSFIVTDLGKFTLLQLKVMLTSFQLISMVSQI